MWQLDKLRERLCAREITNAEFEQECAKIGVFTLGDFEVEEVKDRLNPFGDDEFLCPTCNTNLLTPDQSLKVSCTGCGTVWQRFGNGLRNKGTRKFVK